MHAREAAIRISLLLAITLEFTPLVAMDCNSNGIPDEQEIASGASSDCNGNNNPDECDIAPVNPGLVQGPSVKSHIRRAGRYCCNPCCYR